MANELKDWKQTAIYRSIDAGERERRAEFAQAKHLLDGCMDRIQSVLQQGGTAPTDFTLHDAQHGYRVAERMVEIVPADVLPHLTAYELALLLLSAYLHDIGMTPEQHRVRGHYRYLLTGDPGGLAGPEVDRFRQWLDEHGDGLVPPLCEGPPTGRTLGQAEWLVAHYCRERHNDWSGEWIESNLAAQRLGAYVDWRRDLIAICKSHHQGFDELTQPRFDPIEVGAGQLVHLRYLAAVLRLADVMENDPERTPEVVLRQRDVDLSSLIYWHKDQGVTTTRTGEQYRLTARPGSALIHKAIKDTAGLIEAELLLCRRLADETDFSRLRGSSAELRHRWDLSPTLTQRIEPMEDAYEYIDGSFRPDVRRVLALLAGVELYGDPMAAVRELLQNAFDAVRERIARERLAEPGNPRRADLLGQLYGVRLRLERVEDRDWLVCADQGAGMTKSIVRDHLLVSGAVKRADLLQLARRCEEAGIRLERTAKFGIGVLSYFMVADRLHIRTRRCQSAQSGEASGWSFQTDGLSGFGELKRDPDCVEGTEVWLRLKPEVGGGDTDAFWDSLVAYLRSVVLRTPCRLQVTGPTDSAASWSVDAPGWVRQPGDYADRSLTVLESSEEDPQDPIADLTPSKAIEQKRSVREKRTRLREEVHARLRWSQPVTGELPGGLGSYRIFFPWFDLEGGACLDFFSTRQDGEVWVLDRVDAPDRTHGVAPWCPLVMGWFGIGTDHGVDAIARFEWRGVIELDWTSAAAATLEVSRGRAEPTERAMGEIRELSRMLKRQLEAFAREQRTSVYAAYNSACLTIEPPDPNARYWLYQHETEQRFEWRPISYPAILSEGNGAGALMAESQWLWRGRLSPRLTKIAIFTGKPVTGHLRADRFSRRYGRSTCLWEASELPPDRLLARMRRGIVGAGEEVEYGWRWGRGFCAVWTDPPTWQTPRVAYPEVEFPPEWQEVCLANKGGPALYWNRDHWLVQATTRHAWERLLSAGSKALDPRGREAELTASAELSAAWLLRCLTAGERTLVDGLTEHAPDLYEAVWERATRGRDVASCWAYVEHDSGGPLVELGPHGWRGHHSSLSLAESTAVYDRIIPKPGDDWCVYPLERGRASRAPGKDDPGEGD